MTTRSASGVVVLSLLTVACATTSAPSKGAEVAVVSQAPSDCRSIGPVSGSYSRTGAWSSSGPQVAAAGAQQDLLENAAKQGATHVVIDASPQGTGSPQFSNLGYVTGAAYACAK